MEKTSEITVEIQTEEQESSERIVTAPLYNRAGDHVANFTKPFRPGMILERAGRKYRVDEKGTQRRIE